MNLKLLYNKKGIGFFGVVMLIITVFIFHDLSGAVINLSPKAILMTIIYFIIALASDDYAGIENMINRVWATSKSNRQAELKLQLIRSFISVNVVKWHKYFVMYQDICKDIKPEKYFRVIDILMKIPKGIVSFKQFLWIMAYVSYNLFKSSIFVFVTNDADFLIDLVGIGFFMYTSSSVIGMDNFMSNIFDAIKPSELSIENVEFSLGLLEDQIIFGAHTYGFLTSIEKELINGYEVKEPKKEEKKK
ncbi:MAG: hypothetical protein GY853_16060 [PVC group bacterium]|nr:hypothetical protein [PVC group bacterium]